MVKPYRKNESKFCSYKCYYISKQKAKVDKVCPVCNKSFAVHQSKSSRIYCSATCQATARTGYKHSKESREKMSITSTGKKLSEEHRRSISISKSGTNNPNWKGGKRLTKKGYIIVYCPYHPRNVNRCVLEHRLICEQRLHRFLEPNEVVHHIDFNKANNKPENLFVFDCSFEHMQFHYALRENPSLVHWLISNII